MGPRDKGLEQRWIVLRIVRDSSGFSCEENWQMMLQKEAISLLRAEDFLLNKRAGECVLKI